MITTYLQLRAAVPVTKMSIHKLPSRERNTISSVNSAARLLPTRQHAQPSTSEARQQAQEYIGECKPGATATRRDLEEYAPQTLRGTMARAGTSRWRYKREAGNGTQSSKDGHSGTRQEQTEVGFPRNLEPLPTF